VHYVSCPKIETQISTRIQGKYSDGEHIKQSSL